MLLGCQNLQNTNERSSDPEVSVKKVFLKISKN